jgi:uncharacterized protein YecT (DUF1311 family)
MAPPQLLLVSLSLFFAVPLHAEAMVDCKSPKYTPEFNFCSEQAYKAADKKLNDTYKKAQTALSDEDKQALLSIQRDWLKLRDQHCNLETKETKQGTAWYQFHMDCQTRLTQARTVDIESLLQYR